MQQTPVIHVVDDDESFRVAICRLLQAGGYAVRAYSNAGDFLLSVPDGTPGCILMDVCMPGPSGLELQEALSKRAQTLPVIFITAHGDIPLTVRAMKAGAIDMLTKPVKRETLLNSIQNALAQWAAKYVIWQQLKNWRACHETLTSREAEVFDRVVAGRMNKEIASELQMAERTVKAHRSTMMEKMRATSIAELVHMADQLFPGETPQKSF